MLIVYLFSKSRNLNGTDISFADIITSSIIAMLDNIAKAMQNTSLVNRVDTYRPITQDLAIKGIAFMSIHFRKQ